MSSIIMIGGGVQERRAVKVAQSMGHQVIVTDRNADAPCRADADVFWQVDGRDVETLAARTLSDKERLDIVGVFTLTELVTSVSVVAAAADLPGASVFSSVACQNKGLAKQLWLQQGVATPQGRATASLEEAVTAFQELGGQAFVKASVGFGGQGGGLVESLSELHRAYPAAKAASIDGTVIVEEYVSGTMHDVNGIFDERGVFHAAGIADRSFHPDYPIEVEARCPSWLSEPEQQDLLDLVEASARALGITFGPVKADAVLTDDGFKILEMAPRLHGPRGTLWLVPLAYGFEPLVAALQVLTGESLSEVSLKSENERACVYRAIMPDPGRIVSISGIDRALELPGIEKVLLFAEEGTSIRDYRDSTQVPGYVYATGQTLEAAEDNLDRALQTIVIETLAADE